MSRRGFLLLAGSAVAACTGDSKPSDSEHVVIESPPTTTRPQIGPYPFTLGVASGDPDHQSVVLWTRVERKDATSIRWEVSPTPEFAKLTAAGEAIADHDTDFTIKALATELPVNAALWFRFEADGHWSPPARTRTAPAPGSTPERLVIGQVSCQRRSSGYWTAYDDLVADAPDLVVHCGDYIYEVDRDEIRPDDDPEAVDLDGYRSIYRKYRADPSLQAAHAVAPFLCIWDDHEVDDNVQGNDPGTADPSPEFDERRAAAFRAWWEYQPTRLPAPKGVEFSVHRTIEWGSLLRLALLDTRSNRDDQPCGPDLGARCAETATISMLGNEQEQWFDRLAETNTARWFVPVQSVMLQRWKLLPGAEGWNLDGWDGYTGARNRFLRALSATDAAVVMSGDVHSSWVGELLAATAGTDAFEDPRQPVVGVEFVGPGISSSVPTRLRGAGRLVELQNDHVKWSETRRRGWVRHEVTPDDWTATYRLVSDADVPDSVVETANTFVIRQGTPGVSTTGR